MEEQAVVARRTFKWQHIDRAWAAVALIPLILAIAAPDQLISTLQFTGSAFLKTLPFIAFAVLMTAYLSATGANNLISKAFSHRKIEMILLASLAGGLSPFCSCEVIPFIAALLAAGAPISAVMAFWLSSPLMDPPMFIITTGALGFEFALAKTACAVGLGLLGGFGTMFIERLGLLKDQIRPELLASSCCGSANDKSANWAFWTETYRRSTFGSTLIENSKFLAKWLLLAYLLESLMLAWIPPEWIASTLGGNGIASVMTGALIGIPAYLNGYAAVPLVGGLIQQGMSQATAMTFLLAGGVTCIPAAIAVWALVRKALFACYLGFAFAGAILAGLAWGVVA